MSEEVFHHKYSEKNGDIIEMRVIRVPKSESNPEGISYSLVYIRNSARLVGYDNFEGHSIDGSNHHKHIKDRVIPYNFIDEWTLFEDFADDLDKIKRGAIK